jgi:hypothetical protein
MKPLSKFFSTTFATIATANSNDAYWVGVLSGMLTLLAVFAVSPVLVPVAIMALTALAVWMVARG